jgi:hypothetical protein
MPRLLGLLAARSSGLLNMSELSRASGIAHTTLRRYLALLEATFLLQPLPAWSSNVGKRFVRSPKIHLGDTGLPPTSAARATPSDSRPHRPWAHCSNHSSYRSCANSLAGAYGRRWPTTFARRPDARWTSYWRYRGESGRDRGEGCSERGADFAGLRDRWNRSPSTPAGTGESEMHRTPSRGADDSERAHRDWRSCRRGCATPRPGWSNSKPVTRSFGRLGRARAGSRWRRTPRG